MSIDFSDYRWERIKENSRAWWAGELKRPLIHFHDQVRDPGRPERRPQPMGTMRSMTCPFLLTM